MQMKDKKVLSYYPPSSYMSRSWARSSCCQYACQWRKYLSHADCQLHLVYKTHLWEYIFHSDSSERILRWVTHNEWVKVTIYMILHVATHLRMMSKSLSKSLITHVFGTTLTTWKAGLNNIPIKRHKSFLEMDITEIFSSKFAKGLIQHMDKTLTWLNNPRRTLEFNQ